jgi:hypothetical protein
MNLNPTQGIDDLDSEDIEECLNDNMGEVVSFNVSEIDESDILVGEPNIDQGGSVELGRRRINLRKSKEYSIPAGSACRVRAIKGPTMLVEDVSYQKNQQAKIGDTKEYEIAQCIWFANDVMNRAVFKATDLELIETVEPAKMSTINNIIKQYPAVLQEILDGQKINAIKKVREITGLGLKEAKDLVESVTSLDIERWKQGIYR